MTPAAPRRFTYTTQNFLLSRKVEHRLHCQIARAAGAVDCESDVEWRTSVATSIREQKAPILGEATSIEALTVSSTEAAQYVERMCSELAGLADRSGLGFLAYLLEVAREEAVLHCEPQNPGSMVVHGEVPPGGR